MNRSGGTVEHGKRLLPVLGIFLCLFVLLGAAYCVLPEGKPAFPLLGGVSARLDRVAGKLKAGSPIQEAAEAFFHETVADSN